MRKSQKAVNYLKFQKEDKLKVILGIEPGQKFLLDEIQKHMKPHGLIFSAPAFLETPSVFRKVISKGIKDYYDFDDLIILDSGAWMIAKRKLSIKPDDVLSLALQLQPDIFVTLDVTGNPPDEKKSFENFKYMYKKINIPMIPVIHKPTQEEVFKWYLDYDFEVFGHGGYTPEATSDTLQLTLDLKYMHELMKKYTFEKIVHIFGIAEPKMINSLKYLGDWVDSVNWKITGYLGDVWCPHCLEKVHVSSVKTQDNRSFENSSSQCVESIQKFSEQLGYDLSQLRFGDKGWIYRSVFNAILLYHTDIVDQEKCKLFDQDIKKWTLIDYIE